MKKIFCAYILLLMCLGTWAQGGRKMSYDIRRMASQYSQVRRTASANSDKKPESVRAMIRFQSGEAEAVMARYGCRYLSRIGDIYVADIPVAQLQAMADDERVVRIENHQRGRLLMDVSPQWINTPAIANDTRLPQAYTGQGVMLGIIDIGIEVGHPNFYTADGSRLRITRFLDQLASEDESFGEMIPLGREYVTEADIKAKAGNTNISNTNLNQVSVDVKTGNAKLNAAEELDQYDIDCKVRNGNIRIGNEKSSGGYSSKGQDGSSIKVKANTGSIEID